MKILLVNEVCGHTSTGRICAELAEKYAQNGHEVKIAYGRDAYVPRQYKKYAVRIGRDWDVKMHGLKTRFQDEHGFGSQKATETFIKWAGRYQPDLLWLHNLHGYYIQIEILFAWIKTRTDMKVRWTLHDCWAFTGHCTHFTAAGCMQWKEHCRTCCQIRQYPKSFWKDNSFHNFERKRAAFTGVKNMTIITPSRWLSDLAEQSFLKEYTVQVHHNEVNRDIFKKTPSDFRNRYHIGTRKMLLGVASVWSVRKGLADFIKLAGMLDSSYVIVLVGLTKKQARHLPDNIIGIGNIRDEKELAGIYSSADLFLNPSVEETYGMTTEEAMCCGTRAIVYKGTACEEVVFGKNGTAVRQGAEYLYQEIMKQIRN